MGRLVGIKERSTGVPGGDAASSDADTDTDTLTFQCEPKPKAAVGGGCQCFRPGGGRGDRARVGGEQVQVQV